MTLYQAGFMAGGAAFIAAPIVGAQQEGATGFVKGLGLGLVRTDNCQALSLSLLSNIAT